MMKEKLQEHLNYYLSLDNDYNQVLGIFLYGSQNYGTANEESDVDCIILTIPTLENLLFSSKFSKEYKNPDTDEHIVVKDLRAYYEELAKGSPNALEIIFSKYYILNEKYSELFTELFLNKREELAYLNFNKTFLALCGTGLNLDNNKTISLNKKTSRAYRIRIMIKHYLEHKPYADCIYMADEAERDRARTLKFKAFEEDCNFEYVNSLYNIKKTMEEFKKNTTNYDSDLSFLKKSITTLVEKSFEKQEDIIDIKDFYSDLTYAEKQALNSIFETIGKEGNISISQMTNKYIISRPVYTKLLDKLEKYKLAEVIKQGVKGTYIKFTNIDLISESKKYLKE